VEGRRQQQEYVYKQLIQAQGNKLQLMHVVMQALAILGTDCVYLQQHSSSSKQ